MEKIKIKVDLWPSAYCSSEQAARAQALAAAMESDPRSPADLLCKAALVILARDCVTEITECVSVDALVDVYHGEDETYDEVGTLEIWIDGRVKCSRGEAEVSALLSDIEKGETLKDYREFGYGASWRY